MTSPHRKPLQFGIGSLMILAALVALALVTPSVPMPMMIAAIAVAGYWALQAVRWAVRAFSQDSRPGWLLTTQYQDSWH